MVWYSHLFQNFPQFVVIHTVESGNSGDRICAGETALLAGAAGIFPRLSSHG